MTDQAVHTDEPERVTAAGVFLGRAQELRTLRADIGRAGLDTLAGRPAPHPRVLLVAGRPGTGRTALVEELLRQVAGGYPDGLLGLELTHPDGSVRCLERALRELLRQLGAEAAPAGAGEEELLDLWRRSVAGRRLVLVLDGVESSEQVLDLLPDGREALVVAVSAGPLPGLSGARPCTVGGLERDASVALLSRCCGPTPRLTVDPRSAEALAEACGDHPTALRLVGAWLAERPGLSVSAATRHLEQTPLPAEPAGGADPRLARAFTLAYEGLSGPTARTLRLLALAPLAEGDELSASALAGCSTEQARTQLERLASLGFVTADPGPDGTTRARVPAHLYPLLREAVEERERPAERLLSRARMLERLVRQLRSAWSTTQPPGSPARRGAAELPRELRFTSPGAAYTWLEPRRDWLWASVRIAVAEGEGELDTLARRLISSLARAYEAHLPPEEAAPELYRLHELVLSVAGRGGLHRERAAALLNLGDLDATVGRFPVALSRYRAALEAAQCCADGHAPSARAAESLGGTHAELGDWARAADWYGRALALRESRGEDQAVARLHGRIGAAHVYAGEWDLALREWRAAASVRRRLGDVAGQARAVSEVARVLEYGGRPQESARACREALRLARECGERRLEAALCLRLADACERLGLPDEARSHRRCAERLLGSGDGPGEEDDNPSTGPTCEIASESGTD
ncbi:tetratricopeptide repeat protein [Streptomyces sp. NPDC005438]|uniref:tetratricopeptide repeat protein n=1 Tax=Streptomyces sp. NPDC005438 TaxID=3156880 RepID=UPI0033B96D46